MSSGPIGRGIGTGKLILCGEHAVVYGHPAIAFAIDRRTEVTLRPTPGPTHVVGPHVDERVTAALCTVLDDTGWRVEVHSDIPVGRGMGSSAALAVALVRARADLAGRPISPTDVVTAAMPIERAFHGNPSGLNVEISARGGCLRFRRGPPIELTPVTPGDSIVVVLDTGEAGNTAALVAGVADRRPGVDPDLERIGLLVDEAVGVLGSAADLGPLLTENHRLLARIGVSTPALDTLVELALGIGAHGAKLAGAGGGGVVLALVDDPAPLLKAAASRQVEAFATTPWSLR